MKLLVVNAGSSSVKFTCFAGENLESIAGGLVERIGISGTHLKYRTSSGIRLERDVEIENASQAVEMLIGLLTDAESGVLAGPDEIAAVGHRVVHGGEKLTEAVAVDGETEAIIEDCARLAPLHNPPNLAGIRACRRLLPGALQVAVLDTAFHAGMPPQAYLYGLPYKLYQEAGIRRYGFHGTSHQYVARRAARFLERPLKELKLITCHLGNGCSITAVDGGRGVDTSMGFTPLEGLVMGTRCGDMDPAVVFHLIDHLGMAPAEVDRMLNKESGILGLAGIGSSDLRDVEAAAAQGDPQACTALDVFTYRIKKYIGAYAAVLGRLDAVVFTAGIGENSPLVRAMVCQDLDQSSFPPLVLDKEKNQNPAGLPADVSAPDSPVRLLVVPTDEEAEIATQTAEVFRKSVAPGR